MSLLSNEINIADDARRLCGQQIEGEKSVLNNNKRQKLSSDNQNPQTSDQNVFEPLFQVVRPENINDLSPEVFQTIIARYLKSHNWRKLVPLRLVCKHWRSNIDSYLASRHGFQYTGRVAKGSPPPVMNYYEFNAMLAFYPNMRQLIVKNFTVTDHLIAILRQNVPKIERLSLYGCRNLTWKGITILAVRFPQINFLDISNCELDENRLSILCENLHKLKIMNAINPGREITGLCLSKLGPDIQDIWIGLNHLTDVNPALRALISGNGKNLLHFGLIVANYQSTDWNLITDNMSKLRSLKLTFGSYGSGTLKHFAKLKNLEFLVLAEDSRREDESVLTDESLIPVIKGCNRLKSIAIAGTKVKTCRFTHRSISLIPKYCPHMEQIRFLNGHNVLDSTLLEFASIPTLHVLHLSSMARITDKGIIDFLRNAKKIRNFRVSDCPKVTEAIIEPWIQIAQNRPQEKLKVYLEGVPVTRSLHGLPSNLKLDIKEKPNNESVPKRETTLINNNVNAVNNNNIINDR